MRVAAVVASVVTLVGIPLAAAAYGSLADGYQHVLGSGTTWLGNFVFNDAYGYNYVYCAGYTAVDSPEDASAYGAPVWLNGAAGDSWTGVWGTPSTVPTVPINYGNASNMPLVQSGADLNQSNTGSVVQSGRTLTGANLDRMGYVLAVYGPSYGNDTQAAQVRMLIMEKFQTMYASVWDQRMRLVTSPSSVANRSQVNFMWNDAIASAGPYTWGDLAITINPDQRAGTLEGIGIYSAAGNIYGTDGSAGWTATITSGNAVWDANNGASLSGSLSEGALQSAGFHVTPSGTGLVQINVAFTSVPDWRVAIRTSPTGEQPMMYGRRTTLSGNVLADQPVRDEFLINVDTTTSAAIAASGDTVTDDLLVSIPPLGGAWVPAGNPIDVTSTLYGPFDTQPVLAPTVPGGATVAGTVTTTITGVGTYTTPGVVVTSPGYYVWHETAPAEASVFAGWSAQFGRPAEITLVPWSPTGSTDLDRSMLLPGDAVVDTATLTGGQPSGTSTVQFDLYQHDDTAPPSEGAIPPGATIVSSTTESVTFDAGGAATVATTLTVPLTAEPGYFTVVMTIDGTSTMNQFTSNYGIAGETALIQWDPTVTTVGHRAAGNILSDDVDVVGFPSDYGTLPDETVPITVSMYFVGRDFTGDITAQCVPENLIASTTITSGNGLTTATGPAFDLPDHATPGMDGTYLFQHVFPGTTRVAQFAGTCGEPTETMFLVLTAFNGTDLAITGPEQWRGLLITGSGLLGMGGLLIVVSLLVPKRYSSGARRNRRACPTV